MKLMDETHDSVKNEIAYAIGKMLNKESISEMKDIDKKNSTTVVKQMQKKKELS